MMRGLFPRFDFGPWGGAALSHDGSPQGDEANGYCIVIQWLGVLIEIGVGRVA